MKAWWRSRTLRFRLALWYAVCGLFLLSTFGTVIYFYAANRMASPLDRHLRKDLGEIRQRLVVQADSTILWDGIPLPPPERWDPTYPWFELWDDSGLLVCRLWPFDSRQVDLLPGAPPRGRENISVFNVARDLRVRVLSVPYEIAGRPAPWMIRVINVHEPAVASLGALRWTLFIGIPGIVALLVVGGYAMMRYWVKPLDQIVADTDRISADDLSLRIAVHNPNDELGRITAVFNRTLDRLERSFVALDRFVADASHELRTPLTTLRSVGQVALRQSRSEAEYREVITSMVEDSQHLESLVRRLLELASVEGEAIDIHRSSIRLDAFVAECVGDLGILAEVRGQRIEIESTECTVVTDPVLLRQALQNLLDNAIKYGPEKSRIQVTVRDVGPSVQVSVHDEGPGLNKDSVAHFAERFFRPDSARSRGQGGFGLGLSITKAYLRVLGGTLDYEPGQPTGSAFRLTLPKR